MTRIVFWVICYKISYIGNVKRIGKISRQLQCKNDCNFAACIILGPITDIASFASIITARMIFFAGCLV